MKKYTYLINNDAQTLSRVGEPMAVRGDSGVAEVEFIIPSGFVINPTEALWRAYYRLPGKREAHFVTLPTPTATESGDWTTTWTVTHAVTQSAGRLAFSLTAFSGETVQWDSRVAILQINESVYDGESEESEEPYIGRLATLEGDMAQIRGEWEGVQDEFDDLKEVATAGVPVAVEEAADMINDGRIYIYTGTEPGYTAGHVYYYVNGALTDGGQYGGITLDATLTSSAMAAPANAVGQIKEDLSDITGNTPIAMTNGYYIPLNVTTTDVNNPVAQGSSPTRYGVVPCVKGDVFTVNARGGSAPRAYGFVASDGTVLESGRSFVTYTQFVVIAPAESAYFVVNDLSFTMTSYVGRQIAEMTKTALVPRKELIASDDLNNVTEAGVYYYVTRQLPANAPIAAGGVLVVYVFESINLGMAVAQEFYSTTRNFYRTKSTTSSGWNEWVEVTKEDDAMSEIPVLALTGDVTGMSKDDSVTLDYRLFNATGTCSCKWQGSSSVRYPKKNYTITLGADINAKNRFVEYINIRRQANGNISRLPADTRWGAHAKYCFKANWVDPSMMRNIVCARLWTQIVGNRITNGEVTDGRTSAPCYGAIDGFPVEIMLNNKSIGLYTMNIPKDKWMFSMGNANTEYLVSGEDNGNNATRWKALATLDGSDYSVEYAADGVEDATIAASLNTAIQAAINAGADWETTLAPYVDIGSVFDYFIFTCCINNHDALARNILYGTYDGVKWFMSAYDMDTTFGVDPYGTSWFDVVNDRNQFAEAASMHRLAELVYTYSKPRLKARYKELRETILSDANVWKELSNFAVLIPQRDYDIDRNIWNNMPGTSTANMAQYIDYYRMHCGYLDEEIDAM